MKLAVQQTLQVSPGLHVSSRDGRGGEQRRRMSDSLFSFDFHLLVQCEVTAKHTELP